MSGTERSPATLIRIDRLVLEGIDGLDAGAVRRAVEGELARLISEGGLPDGVVSRGDRETIRAEPVPGRPGRERDLGTQVARQIYQGFGT